MVRATTKPRVEVASGSEGETGNTRGSSSAEPEPEAEVVGGNEVGREEERAKGEGVAAAGQGNLIGRGDIRSAADKTKVGVHGGQAPSEGVPEEGEYEKTDCMRVGRGGPAGMMVEADRVDVRRDREPGRYSR